MKTATKVSTAILALSLFSTVSLAMPRHGDESRGERHEQRIERMLERINATEQQRSAIQDIHQQRHAGIRALHEKMKAVREQLRSIDVAAADYDQQVGSMANQKGYLVEQMTIWRAETRRQISLVLTPEQRAQLAEHRSQRKERRSRRGEKPRSSEG